MLNLIRISDEILEECKSIDSKEAYRQFLERNTAICGDLDLGAAKLGLESSDGMMRARAYLRLSLPDGNVDRSMLLQALNEEGLEGHVLSAAAFCVTRRFAEDHDLQREFLLGADSFKAPRSSSDGRYYLIKLMGFSEDSHFRKILGEALERQSHHCWPKTVMEALKNLGVFVDKD